MLHQVLVQHFPSSAPLRVQGPPSASRLNNLVKWCEMYGIDAGAGESLSLQRIIDASQQPGASSKLLIAKTRCALVLGPARYACAGRLVCPDSTAPSLPFPSPGSPGFSRLPELFSSYEYTLLLWLQA